MKKYLSVIVWAIGVTIFTGYAVAASTPEFYAGKRLRIIVPHGPGGGFDLYSRLIARHIGKHIPGNPGVIVQNMPGAGGLIGITYVYNNAKPDGFTIGMFNAVHFPDVLLGKHRKKFDIERFQWIGMVEGSAPVCALTRQSGITSLEEWKHAKKPVPLGAFGGASADHPRILKKVLGLPIKTVAGYKGTADLRLAAERGEVAGGCWDWESLKVTWAEALAAGDVNVVLQLTPKAHPELPNVPVAMDLAKTEDARLLLKAVFAPFAILRSYMVPPGTPKRSVEILRKAFMDTMKDPEFLADAKKAGLGVSPMSGEELEMVVNNLFALDPKIVEELRSVILQ